METVQRQGVKENPPVIRDLTRNGRRARVELIRYKGVLAVKKTFHTGCQRFLERELFVMKELRKKCPSGIPELLDWGENYFISRYYEDELRFEPGACRLLPLHIVREAMNLLQFFYEQGYSLVDFHPGNILYNRAEGMKFIDFEHLYRYREKPPKLQYCYDLWGIPLDFDGDIPAGYEFGITNYKQKWKAYTGMGLRTLLFAPVWCQRLVRFWYRLVNLPLRRMKIKLKKLILRIWFKWRETEYE